MGEKKKRSTIQNLNTNNFEKKEEEKLKSGPLSLIMTSVKANSEVLISCRNNKKLLGRIKAFDRHMNLILENVKEMWSEVTKSQNGQKLSNPVNKDRFINKLFLRGDSVPLVL